MRINVLHFTIYITVKRTFSVNKYEFVADRPLSRNDLQHQCKQR